MQRLFFLLLFSLAATAHAQNNTPEYKNNSTTTNAPTLNNANLIPAADTVKVESLKEDTKTLEGGRFRQEKGVTAKKQKAVTVSGEGKESEKREMPALEDAESIDSPAAPGAAQMQQQFQSNQFSSSRQYNRRSASDYEQTNMDASVNYYRSQSPNSFETHFYTYLAGHYNTDLYPELKAAAQLQPENTDVKKQLAAYQIITNNPAPAVTIIGQLIDQGVISAGQLAYASDLLVSGDTQSIIVIHGFDDLFAAYYVQQNNHVRPDVQLLSLDFMQSAAYRSGWLNQGLVLPETDVIDTSYLADLCALNPEKALQLSMTIPKDYFVALKDRLYPVGLTFRYSETLVDNFSRNYELWKETMNLKLVRQLSNDSGDNWCTNYLPMLVTLRKQLETQQKPEETEELNREIMAIGARTNTSNQLKKYMK